MIDDEELFFYALLGVALAIAYCFRWYYRGRVVDVSHLHAMGTFGDLEGYLVASPGGRKYVALEYIVENDNKEFEKQVLLSLTQAAALANHLRVAASPHASLVQARVSARREAQAEKARA